MLFVTKRSHFCIFIVFSLIFFSIFEKYSYLTAYQKRNLDRLLPLQENIHLEECL